MTDRPHLADLPGIQDLPAATLEELERTGSVVRIPAGWSPVHQSEPADKAYVVLEGRLSVVRDQEEVATLGPGSLAGEMGLVDHRLRNARLTATGAVVVLAWPEQDFEALRRAEPAFDLYAREVARDRHDH